MGATQLDEPSAASQRLRLQADCCSILSLANSFLAYAFVVVAATTATTTAPVDDVMMGMPGISSSSSSSSHIMDLVTDREYLLHVACGLTSSLGTPKHT